MNGKLKQQGLLYFDRSNLNSLYLNNEGYLSYSRLINNKVVSMVTNIAIDSESELFKTLSSLSYMDNNTFKLLSELSKSIKG